MELCGTILKIYELKSNASSHRGYKYLSTFTAYNQQCIRYSPLVRLSLADAQVAIASDYQKRPNVFRITTATGHQVLIQVQTIAELSTWLEKLSAGSNIANDIEHRSMPPLSRATSTTSGIASLSLNTTNTI